MKRTTIGFLVGAFFALPGLLLILKASSLATHWEMIGPDAWGGTTDPATVHAYRLIGAVMAAFGAVVVALSFHRWLRETDNLVPR
jgi:hypothetical protein